MTRKAVVTLVAVALWGGVFVSGANAAPPICGQKSCSDEIAAGCAGLSGKDRSTCKKSLVDQCKADQCTCTGDPTLPTCPVTTTTTSSTTTTTGVTTTTSTSST